MYFSKLKTKKCHIYSFLLLLLLPIITLAQSPSGTTVTLTNYLNVSTIEELLEAILTILITLATPIIVFFIIYGGYLYVTARGNPEQIKTATTALTYAIIGGVIIIGAVAIGAIIGNLVGAFKP
jgi:hypothetical protein